MGYPYDGFWKSMDTFKEKQELDELYSKKDRSLAIVEAAKQQWHAVNGVTSVGKALTANCRERLGIAVKWDLGIVC